MDTNSGAVLGISVTKTGETKTDGLDDTTGALGIKLPSGVLEGALDVTDGDEIEGIGEPTGTVDGIWAKEGAIE